MTYFDDLSAFTYGLHGHPDKVSALNIGWLDGRFEFPKGTTSDEFRTTLSVLCSKRIGLHRGFHVCDFCSSHEVRGNGQIRVQGINGRWYAAPALIHHYVDVHNYLPPLEFIEAVLNPFAIAICMPGQSSILSELYRMRLKVAKLDGVGGEIAGKKPKTCKSVKFPFAGDPTLKGRSKGKKL